MRLCRKAIKVVSETKARFQRRKTPFPIANAVPLHETHTDPRVRICRSGTLLDSYCVLPPAKALPPHCLLVPTAAVRFSKGQEANLLAHRFVDLNQRSGPY